MGKKRSISIEEIAELANVSVATVSRAINNNGRFSENTRKKVQYIIDKYGYTTDMAAKSLGMSKSKTVGLIVPNVDNEWFSHLVLEMEKCFFERNYSAFICNTSQNEKKEIAYFKSLDSKLVDSIMCIFDIKEIPTNVITRNIPIVCIDRKPEDRNNVCYVESNYYSGGYLTTEGLIKKGCRRITIVSRNRTLSVDKQWLEGYRRALKDYGLQEYKELQLSLDPSSTNYEGARKTMNKLIKSGIPFGGVFATNDWRAYGVMVTLAENHIRAPDDVKVVDFDDISTSHSYHPSLSTVRQDTRELAQKAPSLLLNLTNDREVQLEERRFILPAEVI